MDSWSLWYVDKVGTAVVLLFVAGRGMETLI